MRHIPLLPIGSANVPMLDSIGSVQYVAWREISAPIGNSPQPLIDCDRLYMLFPNGAGVHIDAGNGVERFGDRCLVAIAGSPEEAWAKCAQNDSLMREFGITI